VPDLRSIWRPALYHGHGKRAPFFEGWYFKLVDAGDQHRYAVIPGVFIGREWLGAPLMRPIAKFGERAARNRRDVARVDQRRSSMWCAARFQRAAGTH
jgi:hypothetical protein